MKIYPILNNLGKGKYVFIFILNERAVYKTSRLNLPIMLMSIPHYRLSMSAE